MGQIKNIKLHIVTDIKVIDTLVQICWKTIVLLIVLI